MTLLGTSIIILGFVIFLIGYWFLGKSSGEQECPTPIKSANYGGGIAGIVIGIIFMISGSFMNLIDFDPTQPL